MFVLHRTIQNRVKQSKPPFPDLRVLTEPSHDSQEQNEGKKEEILDHLITNGMSINLEESEDENSDSDNETKVFDEVGKLANRHKIGTVYLLEQTKANASQNSQWKKIARLLKQLGKCVFWPSHTTILTNCKKKQKKKKKKNRSVG